MRATATLFVAILLLAGCDQAGTFESSVSDPTLQGAPFPPGPLFEGIWIDNQQWDMIKPRPPGIGSEASRVSVYQIAPIDPDNPLSDGIDIPGVITIDGRDHVFSAPAGNGGTFRAIARTVPILLPGWNPPMPEPTPAECADFGGSDLTRIAFRMQSAPHPCGQVPQVYAVDFEGDGECFVPLTSVERVELAVAAGLARFEHVPFEPAWNFAIRPATAQGQGQAPNHAPACVDTPAL